MDHVKSVPSSIGLGSFYCIYICMYYCIYIYIYVYIVLQNEPLWCLDERVKQTHTQTVWSWEFSVTGDWRAALTAHSQLAENKNINSYQYPGVMKVWPPRQRRWCLSQGQKRRSALLFRTNWVRLLRITYSSRARLYLTLCGQPFGRGKKHRLGRHLWSKATVENNQRDRPTQVVRLVDRNEERWRFRYGSLIHIT